MIGVSKAFVVLALLAASVSVILPVPGAHHQNLDAPGRFELLEVGE